MGIGATLPLAWDIRIASDKAKIGFVLPVTGSSPKRGALDCPAWSVFESPRLASDRSDPLAEEALERGSVRRMVPHDDLLSVAREIAEDITKNTAPVSVAITKRLVWWQMIEDRSRSRQRVRSQLIRFDWEATRRCRRRAVISRKAATGVEARQDRGSSRRHWRSLTRSLFCFRHELEATNHARLGCIIVPSAPSAAPGGASFQCAWGTREFRPLPRLVDATGIALTQSSWLGRPCATAIMSGLTRGQKHALYARLARARGGRARTWHRWRSRSRIRYRAVGLNPQHGSRPGRKREGANVFR